MQASAVPPSHALSRRAFTSLILAAPLLPLLPSQALAADVNSQVMIYKDLPKGFTIARPSGWNEFSGMQDNYDIKWQDVIQPLEFVTVLTSPVSKDKQLNDIGEPDKIGEKLASARSGQLLQATAKDIDGIPAYVLEIQRGDVHQLTLLTVNKQKLYSVNASCSQKRWKRKEKLLRNVIDSFKPRL